MFVRSGLPTSLLSINMDTVHIKVGYLSQPTLFKVSSFHP